MRDFIKDVIIRHIKLTEERKVRNFWKSEENLEIEALKYASRTEFQQNNQTAYNNALKKGKEFFDRITSHMNKPKSMLGYTDEELVNIAKKHKTKKDFMNNDNGAYQVAIRRGKDFWDKITSHMDPLGSKHKRMVYAYYFPDSNAIYVGLTYNIDERNNQHLVSDENKKQTSVGKFIKETNQQPKLIKLTNYISIKDAVIEEGKYLEKFKQNGYIILNKVKTGGVGKGEKYTEQELIDLLSQITNYKDLYKNFYPLYKAAKRRGVDFLEKATTHMSRNQINWSEDLVRDYSKDFNSKWEFQKVFGGAVRYAKIHGFWDELFPKVIPSKEDIINVAVNYDTQNDFRIAHPSLYTHAKNLDLLRDIYFKKSRKRSKTKTPDEVIQIALTYNTVKDFYTNDMTTYRSAQRLCKTLGEEFCNKVFSHMK